MSFVTRLGASTTYICKRMINELWAAWDSFSRTPHRWHIFGEAASLPVFPSSGQKHACPAARRDFLLSPSPCSLQAQQDSSVKVTGRTPLESIALSLLRSVFLQQTLYVNCTDFSTHPSPFLLFIIYDLCCVQMEHGPNLQCAIPLVSVLHSGYLTFHSSLLSPLFSLPWWTMALGVKEMK